MRAAVSFEFGRPLRVEELMLDSPAAGEVRVQIGAVAICRSDIHAGDGAWGGALPVVNGHEAAGVVSEIGNGVDDVVVGDHVVVTLIRSCGGCFYCLRAETHLCSGDFALARETRLHLLDGTPVVQGIGVGGFAQAVVVHASQVAVIPASVRFDAASLLACGVITGFGAVTNTAEVEPGASVVVIGAGGVGLNSVQAAVAVKADPVIAVDLVPVKLGVAQSLGATVVDGTGDVATEIRDLTEGRGADYVFVTVGSVAAIEAGLTVLRPGGTLVVVGMAASGTFAKIDASEFAAGGFRVLGSKMGSTVVRRDIPKLVDRYLDGSLRLDELISDRYALDQINDAVAAVRAGEAVRNVIVFEGVAA